jgi:hypothetical protein
MRRHFITLSIIFYNLPQLKEKDNHYFSNSSKVSGVGIKDINLARISNAINKPITD